MELHWLRLLKSTVLELRPLKDYAGQDLIFNPRAYRRRCVTAETLEHPLVRRYIATRLLEAETSVQVPAAAPSMEVVATKEPTALTESVVEPVLAVASVEEVAVEPVAAVESVEAVESEVAETEAPVLAPEASVSEPSPEPSQTEEEPVKSNVDYSKKKRR